MLAAFPFFSGDAHLLEDLLIWIRDLGGCKGHDALLVADADVQWSAVLVLRDLAKESFDTVAITTNGVHVDGWIPGSNSLWLAAAKYANEHARSFWFHEPDCIPVKRDWLTALEKGWHTAGNPPYFGAMVKHSISSLPNPYLEGCSIYHANAYTCLKSTFDMSRSWTLACASETAPLAINTPLVQHFWGENKLPPTFDHTKHAGSPVNTFTLANLNKLAVVFHRNKDGTLVQLLRQNFGIRERSRRPHELVLVFAFCKKDQMLALNTMKWIVEMCHGKKMDRTCVVHFDGAVDVHFTAEIIHAANEAFTHVTQSRYPTPLAPYTGWPGACNWAFQHAVRFMSAQDNSWLWLEPDAIPTQADWLFALEDEYARGGKPFMGTIIGGMGHMNGVAIYPNNTAEYVPSAMTAISQPWDTAMMNEVIPHVHRGNDFILHCRAVRDGRCVDEHGAPPGFKTTRDLSVVEPQTRIFHPCKDGEIIKYLRIFKR
jgi:hypothetical protein